MSDKFEWEDPFAGNVAPTATPADKEYGWEDPFTKLEVPETTPTGAMIPTRKVSLTPEQAQGKKFISSQIAEIAAIPDEIAEYILDGTANASEFAGRALSPSNLEDPAVAAGATFGAYIGAPGGPLTTVTGGVLGAAITKAGIEAAKGTPLSQQIPLIAEEARQEALFTGYGMAVGPALRLLGPQVGKIFGVNDSNIKQVIADANVNKIPLALQDVVPMVSDNKLAASIATGYPKVVGVFPFAGGPQRKAFKTTEKAIRASLDDTINALAPNDSLHQIGIDTFEAAKNMSEQVKGISAGLYDTFYETAKKAGDPAIVPTAPIKKAIGKIFSDLNRPMVGGKPLKRPKIATDFDNYVKSLEGLDEFISPTQLRAVQEDINKFYKAANIKGYDEAALGQLKTATSISQNSMDLSRMLDQDAAADLATMLETANGWHAASMALFGSPSGKKFLKVDKNVFRSKPFESGGITADQLAPQLMKGESPQMIKDLRNIVGAKQMARLTGKSIDMAAEKASKGGVMDFNRFEELLGLTTKDGRETLQEGLKGTGISLDKLEGLLRVAKQHGTVDISDASTFLKRRLALTGSAAVIGGAGMLAPKTLLTTIPALMVLRGGSKFLASPKVLRWMTTALDETANDRVREVALSQMLDAFASYNNKNGEE